MKILLVDDQPRLRQEIAEGLTYLGHAVSQYGDADAALAAMPGDAAPDVLVTDIDLGLGPSGFAFVDAARQHWPGLPVLFISGVWREAPMDPASGPSMLLEKPFRLGQMTQALEELTRGRA